jgi:hypothetical protein
MLLYWLIAQPPVDLMAMYEGLDLVLYARIKEASRASLDLCLFLCPCFAFAPGLNPLALLWSLTLP